MRLVADVAEKHRVAILNPDPLATTLEGCQCENVGLGPHGLGMLTVEPLTVERSRKWRARQRRVAPWFKSCRGQLLRGSTTFGLNCAIHSGGPSTDSTHGKQLFWKRFGFYRSTQSLKRERSVGARLNRD